MIEYCGDSEFTPLVLAMLYGLIIWVFIAQRIKRCRDIGISGWWQFIPLSGILLIYLEGLNRGNNHAENLRQSTYSVFTKIFPLSTISG